METPDSNLPEKAAALAETLLVESKKHLTRSDRRQAERLQRMMKDPDGKAFTIALADQAFRAPTSKRSAKQFRHLIDTYGIPDYLSFPEKAALRLADWASRFFPWIVMPAIRAKVRHDSRRVILSAEYHHLNRYLNQRRSEGARLNLNLLGEAVLGEEEAARRLENNLALLRDPNVAYISIKISALFSQINELAFVETVTTVKDRLRILYRAARDHLYRFPDGREVSKFVNLDMEEYSDLHLTVAVFRELLDEEEFQDLRAGIVLQAYLPDSFAVQQELTEWTKERVAKGGASLKLRIVKGANLAMERVEASAEGWPQAPYRSKEEVDSNFKRMLAFGLQSENAQALHIGIASHNLFDIAYAMLLRESFGSEEWSEFEMLEGMANHQAAVVSKRTGSLLFYAPIVAAKDFLSAIAYLVRRLDENTSPQNFLHDLFGLEPGSKEWKEQKERFLVACRDQEQPATTPNRTQNRTTEKITFSSDEDFVNASDTDWALSANRKWINDKLEEWRDQKIPDIPLHIGGSEILNDREKVAIKDPSRPDWNAGFHLLGTIEDVDHALNTAVVAGKQWKETPVSERKELLLRCAESLARVRGDAIACMVCDAGKAVSEADGEVSEAVDFANYYARSLDDFPTDRCDPLGVVVITPPWNFPFAIPCGGVLAALMAGNAVILKPAPETVLTGWILVNALWDAGVSRELLQFLPCPDNEIGKSLIIDERTSAVILTGAYETAQLFRSWKPDLKLFAETSGKNALIISAASDLDLAVSDLVRSAFGHSGQKCSAASLAIVEAEIYDSEMFRRKLFDAASSLRCGASWDLRSVVTPLIRPPDEALLRGLTELDEGEEWLLRPEKIHDCLWTPGIRMGVKPGSWYHQTECFGPVLGIMRAETLDDAFAIQNSSRFGLTGGIHSLDRRETKRWRKQVEVGNAYINRKITGAIVNRQPFGGWKKSAIGPGAKAGGPNYVASLCRWRAGAIQQGQVNDSTLLDCLFDRLDSLPLSDDISSALADYEAAWLSHFSLKQNPSQIRGEENTFRYRPASGVVLRIGQDVSEEDLMLSLAAAHLCNLPLLVSFETAPPEWLGALRETVVFEVEGVSEFRKRLQKQGDQIERLRIPGGVSLEIREVAVHSGIHIADAPVLRNGRLELLHYLREQSISRTTHRYGNLMDH